MTDDLFQNARALHAAGRLAEAQELYKRVLAANPRHARALHFLGVLACQGGHSETGLVLIERCLDEDPEYADALGNHGIVLAGMKRYEEAEESYRKALAVEPENATVRSNFGNMLTAMNRYEEAERHYRLAVAHSPNAAPIRANLAVSLKELGRLEESVEMNRAAIALDPDLAQAHHALAMTLLALGAFTEGWREYAWRWRDPDFPAAYRSFDVPEWDGGDLEGGTVLIWAEQGMGDAIQFARFAPMAAERGGRAALQCDRRLVPLLSTLAGAVDAIGPDEDPGEVRAHLPLMDLPRVFGAVHGAIPAPVPYLSAEPERAERWRARLGEGGRFRVGLCWRGNPNHREDWKRSMRLEDLAPILDVPGVDFLGLQIGGGEEAEKTLPPTIPFTDPTRAYDPSAGAFVEDAAVLESLDLVITVDTAMAHLAGALGRPVWLLLSHVADWRWMTGRDDSPWYPTMRLFRQKERGDWSEVAARAARALAKAARDKP